jgi:hypothetical protein
LKSQHAGTIRLGSNPGDNATLNITSGWLKVEDETVGSGDGTITIGADPGATATVNLSGGRLIAKSITKGTGGSFNFTGGTLAADIVDFDLVNDGGTIAPGESAGMTQVLGDLSINSGLFAIELGGTTAGTEFDQLLVTGNATLGGTLDVSLLSGFTLGPDSSFDILGIAGSRTGEFAGLSEGSLVGNFSHNLFITYMAGDGNDVALYTASAVAGDFDLDGDVDGADFLAWQRNPSVGNLTDWQANFGASASANRVAVPEPLTSTLTFISLLLLFNVRQRKIKLR